MKVPTEYLGRNRASRYPEAFAAYERRCRARVALVYRNLADRLRDELGSAVRVLDIGVGTGSSAALADYLPDKKLYVTGIDDELRFFPIAKERFSRKQIATLHFARLDMRDRDRLGQFCESFDLVHAGNVLYPFVTDRALLRAIYSCCKIGRYFAIVHATSTSEWTSVCAHIGNMSQGHGSETLLATLRACGWSFTVERIPYSVEVGDIVSADALTEEQADFLVWLLPRSETPLSVSYVHELVRVLHEASDRQGRIRDERDVVIIPRRAEG